MSSIDAEAVADRVIARLLPLLRSFATERGDVRLVGADELARVLGVSAATVRRAKAAGMPHQVIGTAVRYDADACRAWLSEAGRRGLGRRSPVSGGDLDGIRLRRRRAP